MIVLDTNVISELMRTAPSASVLRWVDNLPLEDVYLTSITLAELLYGIARLPAGSRRERLEDHLGEMITVDFRARVLPFDTAAATHYADIAAHRASSGRPISSADAQIAAVCRCHAATLATRNIKDFADTAVTLINPWG